MINKRMFSGARMLCVLTLSLSLLFLNSCGKKQTAPAEPGAQTAQTTAQTDQTTAQTETQTEPVTQPAPEPAMQQTLLP